MRLFIAIDIPNHIRLQFDAIQRTLKQYNLNAKWVEPHNIHLTLKFLGETPEQKIPEIHAILTAVAHQFKPFSLTLKHFGFFPNEKKPRVFFITTDHENILHDISSSLEEKLVKLEFPRENRFSAHLTLCRFKDTKNIEVLKRNLQTIKTEGNFPVDRIILFKSTLTAKGPLYEHISAITLTA